MATLLNINIPRVTYYNTYSIYSVKYQDKIFDVEKANKKLGIYLKKKNTKKKKVILNINHDDKGIRQLCRFILRLTTEEYNIPFPLQGTNENINTRR